MLRDATTLIWEGPQSALGAVVLAVARLGGLVRSIEREHGRIFVHADGIGISLGLFVFWFETGNRYFVPDAMMKLHEYGHTFQSRWLGPLYLPIVGVPSALRGLYAVLFREITGRRWAGYFDGFPERQADELGGVDRSLRGV